MPWSTIYSEHGADCRFTGDTNGDEIFAASTATLSHGYQQHLHYAILDFSKAESLDLPTADLLRVAARDRQYLLRNPPYALAMIAPQGIAFGYARTFERFMEGSALRSTVVETREQALEWLREQGAEGLGTADLPSAEIADLRS